MCLYFFSLWLTTTVLSPSGSHVSVHRKYIRWKSVDCFSIICSTTIHRSSIRGGEWISPTQAQADNEHNYILKLHTLYGLDCKQNNRRVVAVNECVEMCVPQVRHTSSYCKTNGNIERCICRVRSMIPLLLWIEFDVRCEFVTHKTLWCVGKA